MPWVQRSYTHKAGPGTTQMSLEGGLVASAVRSVKDYLSCREPSCARSCRFLGWTIPNCGRDKKDWSLWPQMRQLGCTISTPSQGSAEALVCITTSVLTLLCSAFPVWSPGLVSSGTLCTLNCLRVRFWRPRIIIYFKLFETLKTRHSELKTYKNKLYKRK